MNKEFLSRIKVPSSPNIDEKVNKIKLELKKYYTSSLKNSYKTHFSHEYECLREYFPEVDFSYEGRIKNPNSLIEKIHRKISQGKSGSIYDIYGKKIVVYSVRGSTDEELLIKKCREIINFLNSYDSYIVSVPDKCKDYVSNPKENGYKAFHVIRNHINKKTNSTDYCSEVHVRTFRMEEQQKFGSASHLLSYKPYETLREEFCPTFLEIGKNGKTYELHKKAALEKYKRDFDAIQEYFYEKNKTY